MLHKLQIDPNMALQRILQYYSQNNSIHCSSFRKRLFQPTTSHPIFALVSLLHGDHFNFHKHKPTIASTLKLSCECWSVKTSSYRSTVKHTTINFYTRNLSHSRTKYLMAQDLLILVFIPLNDGRSLSFFAL